MIDRSGKPKNSKTTPFSSKKAVKSASFSNWGGTKCHWEPKTSLRNSCSWEKVGKLGEYSSA